MEEKILVVDIGNSFIKCAYFINNKIKKFFYNFESNKNVDLSIVNKLDFDTLVIASVVSNLTKVVINKLIKNKKVKVINIDKLEKNIDIKVKVKKEEIGLDLLADLIACKKDYKHPSIIFDIGTVNKVLALDKFGNFIGCSFFPGISTSSKSLFNQTDALPHIKELKFSKNIIGKNTDEAISSGILNSVIYSINGFIKDYKKVLGNNCNVIITGGGSILIKNKIKDVIYDSYLTVNGIFYIYKENLKWVLILKRLLVHMNIN